ncbi:MAG: bifunctional phosphoribosylaminoimidazolecarboxamide formyltransferase/IMP cyclohydrolase, partial [Sphingomicrobium sp.]
EDVTGFPECLDGRVKTLHPAVHAGLLADRANPAHVKALAELGIEPFDLLASNLYPFAATVAAGATPDESVEQIDIGGPAMVRAAAKNHGSVAVVVDPAGYPAVLAAVEAGGFTRADRAVLAAVAFAHVAAYDLIVADWMSGTLAPAADGWPGFAGLVLTRSAVLRYGENPHQQAALYVDAGQATGPTGLPGLAGADQLHGRQMSYNNYVDTDAAWRAAHDFGEPCVAIVKHANPCGIAVGPDIAAAHRKAHACDPVSAFGGIIAANRPLDGRTAELIGKLFSEVIIAPSFSAEALAALGAKKNLRLLLAGALPDPRAKGLTVKSVAGGLLVQSRDNAVVDEMQLKTVTRRAPISAELNDLRFAFRVAKHVKSNTIVYAKDRATVGIGAGQMSRVDSARIAARKAEDAAKEAGSAAPLTKGSVVASDAFFPFADGLLVAIEAGATAVIQPGGSVRDDEVIKAADEHGIAMVF